jgi:hypothetical protein
MAVLPELRLPRGLDALSGETPPRSRLSWFRRSCTHSPDRSINCSDTTRALGSKSESPPHRPTHTAYPGAIPPSLLVGPSPPLHGAVR